MARNRGNDGTRRLRAERLAKYAREVDASMRNGPSGGVPEIGVAVGYEDEDGRAQDPATKRGEGLSLQSIPILVAPPEDVAWFGLDKEAERLCAAIDGRASIADILRTMGIGSESLLRLLTELQESGLVVIDLHAVR